MVPETTRARGVTLPCVVRGCIEEACEVSHVGTTTYLICRGHVASWNASLDCLECFAPVENSPLTPDLFRYYFERFIAREERLSLKPEERAILVKGLFGASPEDPSAS